MRSSTAEDKMMEIRCLVPSELSLVVTRRPLPPLDRLVPLEECIKICSTVSKIPTKTKYLPFSGTVRADKLPLIPYLPAFDLRSRFGGYDSTDESGRRTCNWVRFLKVSPLYNADVNLVGQRYGPRGDVVFEVVREIPFGGELVAYLVPDGGTSEESLLLPALQILRSSLYRRTIDTIMAEAPLDLSRSLLTAPKRDVRGMEAPSSPRRTATSDAEETHSDESPSPSPPSVASLSPPHTSSGFLAPTSCPLAFPTPTNPLLAHHDLRFPTVGGILPSRIPCRISPGIPTPPSSASGSPKDSLRDSPVPPVPKRRERTMLPCSECGKAFDRPSLLKRHMRTHTGEKPHVCDVCGKGFSTSSSLNTHRRIHSGEKPHQCGVCGKRFTASSNLYYHKMTHVKEKPHKCTLCTRSFPTPGDLRSHMFVHNGQWPHKCAVCGKGFSKLTNLRNHTLLHSSKARLNNPPSPVTMETGTESPI